MANLTIVQAAVTPADLGLSRMTDLELWDGVLYSTTRFDGRVASWDIGTLGVTSTKSYLSGAIAGANPSLLAFDDQLVSGGWTAGGLALHALDATGEIATTTDLSLTANLTHMTMVDQGAVTQIYGAMAGSNGIAHITMSSGSVSSYQVASTDAPVSGIATSTIGGTDYIFATSATGGSVESWQIASNGTPTLQSVLLIEDGFWASRPTAIETAVVDGETYLIVAGSGSSSLSVLHASPGGGLQTVDHLLDDRDTRFADVTTLKVIDHLGHVFVIAGGSDDGITVLQLLPGGRLLPRSSMADTPAATLTNPSAIEAASDATGIGIFVASATEAGLTKLRFETGALFAVVTGTAGDDVLTGGSGADVLMDGDGEDTLTGNAGVDVFVLSAGDARDTITDFDPPEDQIDLSAWSGLRSLQQLFITATADGAEITYGLERLVLQSDTNQPIFDTDLSQGALLFSSRLPQVPVPGLAGPQTTPPSLPDRDEYIPPVQDLETEDQGIERLGVADADLLQGTAFNDVLWGQGGDDTLLGNDGADMLFGGSGRDTLEGGAGDDMLSGGTGRDGTWILGATPSNNADRLLGGAGNDDLLGQAGADWMDGGTGDDVLTGGSGRDTFVFNSGDDTITDFAIGVDRLRLDDGLWSGTLNADQVMDRFGAVTGGQVVLDFGADTLSLDGLSNLTALADQIDIF